MRPSIVVRVALAVAILLLLLPASAAAFPLSNCMVTMTSKAADGSTLDTAKSGDDSASADDPFIIDWDGAVAWIGSSTIELKNNTYHVEVFGIPTPIRGGSDNGDDNRDGDGSVSVSANAPFRFTGLYYVSGAIEGSGGTCSGSSVMKLDGDPIGTIPFFIGLIMLILGLLLLILAFGGNILGGILGGLLAGLGLALLLVIFSTLPLGGITPLVVVIIGVGAGVVIVVVRRRMLTMA